MFRNLLFMMTVAGSIVVILYILIYPISRRYFSLTWRYSLLKIAIIFYLFPFPHYKIRILQVIKWFSPYLYDRIWYPKNPSADYVILTNGTEILMSRSVKIILLALVLSAVISFIFLAWNFMQYQKTKNLCLQSMESLKNPERIRTFQSIKTELGIRRKVKLVCSEYCTFPMTGGFFSPIVFLPVQDKTITNSRAYQTILRHELVHIRHHDLLIRLFGIAVIGIHWFNPLSYFLFFELSNISEIYCDSVALRGKDDEERRAYGELILKYASGKPHISNNRYYMGFINNSNKAIYKRRFQEMKMKRKNKPFLSLVVMLLICVVAGGSVLAYDPPGEIECNDDEELSLDFVITDAGEIEIEAEELPYDLFYTDENGIVHDLTNDKAASKVSCTHNYNLPIQVTRHNKDGKGGCTVTYQNATKCSKCGNIKYGDIIQKNIYTKCPH